MNAAQIVEAVLFASDAPLKAEEIARADDALNEDLVEEAVSVLNAMYSDSERAFEIRELGEGYQLLTRPDFVTYLERFDTVPRPSRLSGPALETLAIIAYRQPIGRIEMEYIRGVGSAGVIRTLQDRALVDVVGRGEGIGRPLLFGTTQRFLEHFGFRSLDDLPRPEDLPIILRERTPFEDPEPDPHAGAAEDDDTPEPGVSEVLATESGSDESEDPEAGDADVRPPDADLLVDAPVVSAEGDPEVG
ncbi:MAG: SMC-Scp complex subunit ScpB [Gemmatimonadota bacterium]|nr:MAG: SMC-Scp complex subunit ScpB [Gemmatimonadota bacterium]